MRHKFLKVAALFVAGAFTMNAWAQTDVTSQYLKNADFEGEHSEFDTTPLSSNRAIYQPEGWTVVRTNGNENDLSVLTEEDLQSSNFSAWTINDPTTRGEKTYWARLRWGGQVWNWNGTTGKPTSIELQQEITLPGGIYSLSADLLSYADGTEANNHTYLKITKDNKTKMVEPTIYHEKKDENWENKSLMFYTAGEATYTVALQCLQNWQAGEYISGFDNVKLEKYDLTSVSTENPIDITALVGTAKEDWVGAGGSYKIGDITTVERYFEDQYRTGDMIIQTIELPLGSYEVELYANANWTPDRGNIRTAAAEAGAEVSSVFANTVSVPVPLAHQASTAEAGVYKLSNVTVLDGTLKIGLRNDSEGANWMLLQIKSLKYLGVDASFYLEALKLVIAKAEAFDKTTVPNSIASLLTEAISEAKNVEQTEEAIEAARIKLQSTLTFAEEIQPVFASFNAFVGVCNDIITNSTPFTADDQTTFELAIAKAKEDANSAETAEGISTAYAALETARQTYVQNADPTNSTAFDYTFMLKDPAVVDGKGWSNYRGNQNQQYTGAPDNTYFDSWDGAGQDIYQEVTLPSGMYSLKAAGRASESCTSAYIYIHETIVEIDKAGGNGNDLGNGWKWYTTDKVGVAGKVKIGFKCNTASSQWAGADDFHLYYHGYDAAFAQKTIIDLKQKAENIVQKGEAMNAAVATALANAISGADITKTTRQELEPMISALSNAVDDAETSIDEYKKIRDNKYIDKAKLVDEATADAFQAKYDNGELTGAEKTRQDLNVALANYVATNFKYEMPLTEWGAETSAMWSTQGEHWDGTNTTTYYDANGKGPHTLSKTVDLTPGTYVFKAAGRSSAATTLSISIDIDGVDPAVFNAKGNTGYGIDVEGNATFDETATYARGGQGQGWEWQFVKFTLTESKTVTLKADCQTNNGWASFGNNGLWMDDAAYMSANAATFNAYKKEAEELIKSKMGAAEATALQAAIDAAATAATTAEAFKKQTDDLKAAIDAAKPSAETYTKGKANIDKAKDIMSKTNVYTSEAYATFSEKVSVAEAKYTDGSWTTDEATAFNKDILDADVKAFLISAWTTNDGYQMKTDLNGHIEGMTIGTPTIERWKKDAEKLEDKAIVATLSLEPYETYKVSALVAAARNTTDYNKEGADQTAAPVGVTMQISGDEEATWVGTRVGETKFFEGTFEAQGIADGTGKLTIKIATKSTDASWIMFNNVMYTKQPAAEATAEEIQALKDEIAKVESYVIGFQKGEYAPYNNVAAINALNGAKQALASSNTKPAINGTKDALAAAVWTANATELDAVYNGNFAVVTEGANYPNGWTRTNAWGQMQTKVDGVEGSTAYYNQPGKLVYGQTGAYTMPLVADTYYTLTFKYRSHENNSNKGVTVSILNGEEGLAATKLAGNGSTKDWATGKVTFKTGAAGNYVLTLDNSGNTWMTGVSIVKAQKEERTFTVAENVEWATVILPFDVEIPEGISVYTCSSINNGIVELEEVTTGQFAANTPYIVNGTAGEYKLSGYNVAMQQTYTSGLLTGTYTEVTAPVDSYVLQQLDGYTAFYHVAKDKQPKVGANRCYLTVPAGTAKAPMFSISRGEDTTGIENATLNAQPSTVIYDLMGRKVTTMVKGNMYIVNGKKVIK